MKSFDIWLIIIFLDFFLPMQDELDESDLTSDKVENQGLSLLATSGSSLVVDLTGCILSEISKLS
jgi:hypothetical protein